MSDAPPESPVAPERPAPKNVIEAIARVMEDCPAVGKDGKYNAPGSGSYNFRSIEGVTAALQKLMGRYCVVAVPKVIERVTREFEQNNKPWTEENLKLVYTVYGPGGIPDHIEVGPLYALGRDNSDKGTNKAMTQAFKQGLVQLFVIGDSKDDGDSERAEADSHTRRPEPPPEAKTDGWADAAAEASAHQTASAQIKQFKALVPDDDPALTEIRAYQKKHGWPMAANDLMALSMMVAKAHGAAVAAQEGQGGAPEAESQPEAPAPTPGPDSAPPAAPDGEAQPWDNLPEAPKAQATAGKPLCPWCEKEVIGPRAITGGTKPDDPALFWHKVCYEQKQAEDANTA